MSGKTNDGNATVHNYLVSKNKIIDKDAMFRKNYLAMMEGNTVT